MKIKIEYFSSEHISDVLEISNKEVGENFINENYLDFFINNENAKGIVATLNGKVIGFSFYQWCFSEEILSYIFINKNTFNKIFTSELLIGYRNLTAVINEFQNRGIGGKLVGFSIRELKKKTNKIANVVWKSGNKKTLEKTLEKYGLKSVKIIHNYWQEDSLKRKYECAICGLPPCKCTAEIYVSS